VKLVLKTDAAESTEETGHVGPLIETVLPQQQSTKHTVQHN